MIVVDIVFFAHGSLLLLPPADILQQLATVMPDRFRLFLGVAELLAAIGLTLPGIARVQPGLISWAAAGLMIVMIGATVLHSTRGETGSAMITALLFALLAFVAYFRWKVSPIASRIDSGVRL